MINLKNIFSSYRKRPEFVIYIKRGEMKKVERKPCGSLYLG